MGLLAGESALGASLSSFPQYLQKRESSPRVGAPQLEHGRGGAKELALALVAALAAEGCAWGEGASAAGAEASACLCGFLFGF